MATDPSPLIPPIEPAPRERPRYPSRTRTRAEVIRTAVLIAAAICGGLVVVFIFFVAIGSVNVGDAAVATGIACALAIIWAAGYVYKHRHADVGAIRHDRERRGF